MEQNIKRQLKARKSPWGKEDEIGRLNWVSDESRAEIAAKIDFSRMYDLSVEYFMGMPSWKGAGDPAYQIWMTHTPQGNVNDDLMTVSKEGKQLCSYSGDAFSMYTHTGTHMDAFNHFGYHGEIWNKYNENEHLGSRHWLKCGVDKFPRLIAARCILLDVAGYKGVGMLPDSYGISKADIIGTMKKENIAIEKGDIVLIRTGRMKVWPDPDKYEWNSPGLTYESAEYLVEQGAMILGSDNIGLEQAPSAEGDNYFPVHSYLFAEVGVSMIEVMWLEELAEEGIYEGGLFLTVMPLRGAGASPVQPVFFPMKNDFK